MTLSELPVDIQNKLLESRSSLFNDWKENSAYRICFINKEGTRYFLATRVCRAWNDGKGNYMPFGGGTYWKVIYGRIKWTTEKDPMGGKIYLWKMSKEIFGKSANGTVIPKRLDSKKEVIFLAKQIGNLEM